MATRRDPLFSSCIASRNNSSSSFMIYISIFYPLMTMARDYHDNAPISKRIY
jgi:hypothetical protein